MIATNTLFGLAFTLVSNFTNTVNVPPIAVPQSTNDLERHAIIVRRNDVEVLMMHKRGVMAAISHGTVMKYDTPGSFFKLQDPDLINKFKGPARLTRKQAVELATSTVERLRKNGTSFISSKIKVQEGGRDFPFYNVIFSSPTNSKSHTATVEVDARDGSIPSIWLIGAEFWDQKESDEFRHRVYTPDPKPPTVKLAPKRRVRSPSEKPLTDTNDIVKLLERASSIALALNMDPKLHFCISNVDWEASGHEPSTFLPGRERCSVAFRDGGIIRMCGGAILACEDAESFCANDIWIHGQSGESEENPAYRLGDLARGFEANIIHNFGFPNSFFRQYKSMVILSKGTRHLVAWKRKVTDLAQGFLVEFDTHTGLTMGYGVLVPEVAKRFEKGQKKLERKTPSSPLPDSAGLSR